MELAIAGTDGLFQIPYYVNKRSIVSLLLQCTKIYTKYSIHFISVKRVRRSQIEIVRVVWRLRYSLTRACSYGNAVC